MKKKLNEEAKPKTKKVRLNLYAPEAERVFLSGDFQPIGMLIVSR